MEYVCVDVPMKAVLVCREVIRRVVWSAVVHGMLPVFQAPLTVMFEVEHIVHVRRTGIQGCLAVRTVEIPGRR